MRLEYQIIAAVLLDLLMGDPRWFPHPVRGIGWLANALAAFSKRIVPNAFVAGVMTAAGVVAISGGTAYGIHALASMCHPLAGDVASIVIIYFCIAARDLADHARRVLRPLRNDDLDEARQQVSRIVGRDTDVLDANGVTRAAIESVAENLVDGVLAPLSFAILLGPVGAVCYKSINTLDSMFGYKTPELIAFGWASARLDDVVNWIPARLSIPAIAIGAALLGKSPIRSISSAIRDGGKHSSPNSGLSEAAFAGALNVQLGGPTCYGGVVRDNPTIGGTGSPPQPKHLRSAIILMLTSTLAFVAIGLLLRWACPELMQRL